MSTIGLNLKKIIDFNLNQFEIKNKKIRNKIKNKEI